MTLLFACIAPHGSEAIEQLATPTMSHRFRKTRDGLRKLAKEVGRVNPKTIVIATPHNIRLWKKIGIVTAENSSGTLKASPRNNAYVSLRARCDVDFANKLLLRSSRSLPVVGVNYGTSEGTSSDMPMDWGTLIPLWFMMARCRKKPKLVIVAPSREIPLSQNYEFGRKIADQAEAEHGKGVVFVASADQAHAHKQNGPYGFSKRAKEYDSLVVDAIRKNQISRVMKFKADFVESAKPDSLWQMAMLAGVADRIKLEAELISYEVPTYFGMICASFRARH
jgi:aromatic ring-opening dioxygenase LigB subunit